MASLLIAALLVAPPWRWSHPDPASTGELNVRLVRGSVHAITGPSLSVVARLSAITSDPTQIIIVMKESHDAITLYAQYPRSRDLEMRECLPPLDERGDFYHHDGRVDLDVTMPAGWKLNVEILGSAYE